MKQSLQQITTGLKGLGYEISERPIAELMELEGRQDSAVVLGVYISNGTVEAVNDDMAVERYTERTVSYAIDISVVQPSEASEKAVEIFEQCMLTLLPLNVSGTPLAGVEFSFERQPSDSPNNHALYTITFDVKDKHKW